MYNAHICPVLQIKHMKKPRLDMPNYFSRSTTIFCNSLSPFLWKPSGAWTFLINMTILNLASVLTGGIGFNNKILYYKSKETGLTSVLFLKTEEWHHGPTWSFSFHSVFLSWSSSFDLPLTLPFRVYIHFPFLWSAVWWTPGVYSSVFLFFHCSGSTRYGWKTCEYSRVCVCLCVC